MRAAMSGMVKSQRRGDGLSRTFCNRNVIIGRAGTGMDDGVVPVLMGF